MKFTRPFIASSILIASAAGLVGCDAEDTGSSNVRTAGIHAIFEAVASGDGTTRVEAQLRVGGDDGTYLFLDGDDRLVAFGDNDDDGEADESVDMGHNSSGDRHWYVSRFDTDNDDGEFRIEFQRGEDNDDALESSVTLPSPFTMSIEGIDDEGDQIQRGNDITVTWDPTDDGTINWEIDGSCIWSESGNTNDDGEFTIPAEDIRVQDLDEGENCTVEIILERTRKGDIDPAFGEGGTFWGIQRRGFEFTSTPADDEGDGDGMGGDGSN